jgi:hypothetical protein
MSDMLPAILGSIAFVALICGIVNHLLTSRSQRLDSTANPLRRFSSHEIVRQHSNSGANSHFLSEMVRRLTTSTQHLSEWLLWFTIIICALTALQAWVAWKTFTAPPPPPQPPLGGL